MAMLGELISGKVQVQHLMDAVTHGPTKHILTDALFICPDKKEDLAATMAMINEKAQYYGLTLGDSAASSTGETVSKTQKIRKLQWQVKALQKTTPPNTNKEAGKSGCDEDKSYIPPAVMDTKVEIMVERW